MDLLKEFKSEQVLKNNYGRLDQSIEAMKKSLELYFKNRANPIARSRAKSALAIIRQLRGEL